MICDDCGKEGDDVYDTTCPYAEEIYGETVPCQLCEECAHERCMEI